jgi:hypothetical protein
MKQYIIFFLLMHVILIAGLSGCEEETSNVFRPTVELTDSTSGIVHGLVRDTETDLPMPNVIIISDCGHRTISKENGSYNFRVLEGARTISAIAEDYSNPDSVLSISARELHSLDIYLKLLSGTIIGHVVDQSNNRPIPLAQIDCGDESTQTSLDGQYQIVVPAGIRTIYVTAGGYVPTSRLLTIRGSQTNANINFQLEAISHNENKGQITGRVTNDQGRGLFEAYVSSDDGAFDYTDVNGDYQLFVLPGNRVLTAIAIGYSNQSKKQAVETNRWYFIDFELSQ